MAAGIPTALTDAQWEHFCRDGFINLGQVATATELTQLNQRLDDLSACVYVCAPAALALKREVGGRFQFLLVSQMRDSRADCSATLPWAPCAPVVSWTRGRPPCAHARLTLRDVAPRSAGQEVIRRGPADAA